jgi:hypothetical protein
LPHKDPIKRKEYQTAYHKKNDRRIGRAKRLTNILILERLKVEQGCCHCGFKENPKALQFHHINKEDKNFTISKSLNRNIVTLLRETEKCMILCANCHIIEEYRLNENSLY